MAKNSIILSILTLGFAFGFGVTPVLAEEATENTEAVETTTEETGVVEITAEPEVTAEEEIGTSGEPEIVCADETDENCIVTDIEEEEVITEEESPIAIWPAIISGCAIIITLIVIVTFSVRNRKR